jgi:hypothetical protein
MALGPLQVRLDAGGQWHIQTSDGLLALCFSPEGCYVDDKNLLVASSRLRQHVGRFDGWVRPHRRAPRLRVTGLAGLAEAYRACW